MVGSPSIMVFSISIAFQNLRKNERAFQGLKIQVHSNTFKYIQTLNDSLTLFQDHTTRE